MRRLISIDPGVRACGVAIWDDDQLFHKLISARLIVAGDQKIKNPASAARNLAHEIWLHIATQPNELVIELPQTYRGRAAQGDANDLIALALTVGAIVGRLNLPTTIVRPAEWKGQIPKPKRAGDPYPITGRCKRKLSAEELSRVTLPKNRRHQLDVWDAVGIGLHYLGR